MKAHPIIQNSKSNGYLAYFNYWLRRLCCFGDIFESVVLMPYSSNQSVWPSVDLFSMNHQTSIKSTALNLIPGVVWGIGNLFMFYSQPKV